MKKMTKVLTLAFALISLNIASASEAKAEGYIGGLVGWGNSSGTALNLNSGLAYGATVGYRLMPELGVAFNWQHSNLQTDIGKFDVKMNQYMAEANFFTVFLLSGGLHAGVVDTAGSSDFGFGAHLGFDLKLAQEVSIGLEGYYTYVTQTNDKHSLINLVVPLKFWF